MEPLNRRAGLCDALTLGVGLTLALAYLAGHAASTQGLDSGEVVAVIHGGGRLHPPGFPVFTALARLFTALTPWPTAQALSIFSALSGALSGGLLCGLAQRLGARPMSAAVAALAFGLAPPVFRVHTEPEVFALGHVFALLLCHEGLSLWEHGSAMTARWQDGTAVRSLRLGLAASLSFGAHPVGVLLLPIAALGLYRLLRSPFKTRDWFALILGAALGLCPYALPFLASGEPRWGRLDDLGSLIAHALRLDYGALSLGLETRPFSLAAVTTQLSMFVFYSGLSGAALAVLGLLPSAERRPQTWALRAAVLLGLVAFPLLAGRPLELDDEVAGRFFGMTTLAAYLAAALGLDALRTRLAHGPRSVRLLFIGGGILSLTFVAALCLVESRHAVSLVSHYADVALDALPPDAVLIGHEDTEASGFWEARYARGRRLDVTYVHAPLLPAAWYAEKVERETGYRQPDGLAGERALIAHLLASGRPVFSTLPPATVLLSAVSFRPHSVVFSLREVDAAHPSIETIGATLPPRPDLDGVWSLRPSEARLLERFEKARSWVEVQRQQIND